MKQRSCVLGIDLGTSAIKLVAISREGKVVATERESYSTITTLDGQAEQDREQWLKALARGAREVRSRLAQRFSVDAIALTGQMPTLVVLEADKPAANAITWQDGRADRWANERVDPALRSQIYRKTGVIIDGRYLAPMYQFHYALPQRRTDRILSARDFLFHVLTGVPATDASTASGYGVYNLESNSWDEELCKFWNINVEQLPPIKSCTFSVPLSKPGGKRLGFRVGTPVFLGCADSAAGFYALNAEGVSTNAATILMGSSTVILKQDAKLHWDPQARYLITPLALNGTYGREADLLAGGSAHEWIERVFFKNGSEKTRRSAWRTALDATPDADGLLFAPYLAGGEQGVLWNPKLKGTLIGLTTVHTAAHIARALLEGMLFEIRRCLEPFEEEEPLSVVRVTGWITHFPKELQLLADILGRTVHALKLESASAVGAALLTGLTDIKKYFATARPVILTPSGNSQCYDEVYARYLAQFPAGNRDASHGT